MLPASCDNRVWKLPATREVRGKMRLTVATSSPQRLKPDTFSSNYGMPEGIP